MQINAAWATTLLVALVAVETRAGQPLPTTVEDVCAQHPETVRGLFDSLDLERPGLQAARRAWQEKRMPQACRALLAYYRTCRSGQWLRRPLPTAGEGNDAAGDAVCKERMTFYEQTAVVPHGPDGRLQWDYTGPAHDREWALALNRHFHLGTLLDAYQHTGNAKYAAKLDDSIRDWVISSLPYPKRRNASVLWRGLEVSFRVKIWARVFYERDVLAR